MAKLFKLISGCLVAFCLVIWDGMSSMVFAESQITYSELAYSNQIAMAAEAHLPFLYAAYTIAWGLFFVYIFYLSRKQKRMHEELELLRSLIKDKEFKSKFKNVTPSGNQNG